MLDSIAHMEVLRYVDRLRVDVELKCTNHHSESRKKVVKIRQIVFKYICRDPDSKFVKLSFE